MYEQKPYRIPGVTIEHAGGKTGRLAAQPLFPLNTHFNRNFFDFINQYRSKSETAPSEQPEKRTSCKFFSTSLQQQIGLLLRV